MEAGTTSSLKLWGKPSGKELQFCCTHQIITLKELKRGRMIHKWGHLSGVILLTEQAVKPSQCKLRLTFLF